jgi:hypothetical protein
MLYFSSASGAFVDILNSISQFNSACVNSMPVPMPSEHFLSKTMDEKWNRHRIGIFEWEDNNGLTAWHFLSLQ